MSRPLAGITHTSYQQRSYANFVSNSNYYEEKNAILNRYLREHVAVDRNKSNAICEQVLPLVKELLKEINYADDRFGREPLRVGSSTQGLSVNAKGDYDISVVFKLRPDDDDAHSSELQWNQSAYQSSLMMYGFADQDKDDTSSLRKDLVIVHKESSQPHPGPGYLPVRIPSNYSYSYSDDLQFDGDLIPYLVKCRFKCLLQDALEKLGLTDVLKLSRDAHGPALTLQTQVTASDDQTHSVSIDLAVIIQAGLEFLREMGWPVSETSKPIPYNRSSVQYSEAMSMHYTAMPMSYGPQPVQYVGLHVPWPPPDKVAAILEKGINAVAKKQFFWQVSFVELEKILVEEIDKDGGCRKKVHRIMKSVFYEVCKEKPVLTSYMLKNVWFLECEKYPDPKSWTPDRLAERYYGCLESLRDYARQRMLPQYFHRGVNLLEGKKLMWKRMLRRYAALISRNASTRRGSPKTSPLSSHPQKFQELSLATGNVLGVIIRIIYIYI